MCFGIRKRLAAAGLSAHVRARLRTVMTPLARQRERPWASPGPSSCSAGRAAWGTERLSRSVPHARLAAEQPQGTGRIGGEPGEGADGSEDARTTVPTVPTVPT